MDDELHDPARHGPDLLGIGDGVESYSVAIRLRATPDFSLFGEATGQDQGFLSAQKDLRQEILGTFLRRARYPVEIPEDLHGAGQPKMRLDIVVLNGRNG